jgi:exonuclease SbcC
MAERIWSEITTYSKSLEETVKIEEELRAILLKLDLDNLNQKNNQLRIQIKKLEEQFQAVVKDISATSTQAGMLSEKLTSREQDLVKLDKLLEELKVLEKEQQLRQMVAQGFASGGIPTMIIYTILDDLQIEANKLLTQIRPGLELQFSIIKNKSDGQQEDTLDITYRIHGVERDYEQLSGGQKLMVALSLKLGLSLVIQHRLGTDIKFLELDEVDQSLDKAGVDAFADVIKQWQDKFKIFVITHNDALKTKFSNAILVEHDGPSGSVGKAVTTW